MAKISDTELRFIINSEINNSLGFLGGALSNQRKKALEYYLGDKLGTEIEGRSQVVSTDVADTIETILPNLIRIFTASDQTVKCDPVKAEDVALAEQATNYINYVFNKDNDGFKILYSWFKDALLEKNGIVKIYWDESQKVEQETYKNLSEEEYQLLINEDNVDIVEEEEFEDELATAQLEQLKQVAFAQGGDGVAELRKVTVAGDSGYQILDNESADFVPFCSLTPIPMPHRFYGRSVAELVEDVQLVKSTVMRQLLDNMYLTNNNRVAIMDGMVNLDDLLTSRPGGVVRTKQPPSQVMMPMQSQTISQQAFPLLEYLDTVRETRTGVTRYSQGLDADSLNKTATGINTLMTQTQMRMELIARIFAETGVKDLFKRIFELTVKYQDKERIIQLNNQFVPVRPTEWKNRYNISITVGLGSGSKEQQLVILNSILEKQLQAFQLQGGKEYPMVSLKNIYNTLAKMIENAGLKNVENYFVNPDIGARLVQPTPPPAPSPIEKIEFTRIDAENKRKQAELELKLKELQSQNAKNLLDFESKIKELELKYNAQIDTAQLRADAELNKVILSNQNKAFTQAQQSSMQLGKQIESINEPRRTEQTPTGTEQVGESETSIRESDI
jgi:hypothetical protein